MGFEKYYRRFLITLITLTFLIPKRSPVIAQDLPLGARSLGMGGTYVALANTSDALFLNPGGLSQIDGTHISIFYQKPFGLQDVNFGSAAASISAWKTRLNFGVTTFGNNFFNEQTFNFAFSHHYQKRIFYGVAVRYKSINIENHGSSGTFGLDLGFVVPISPQLSLGFLTKNINRANIGKSDEELPQSFSSGLSITPVADLIVNFEIFKDVRFPEEIRFGVEFQPIQKLALRTGTATNPSRFSAGFGVSVKQFTIDYAFFTHNDLGLTHQFSFSIHLKEKLEKVKTPVMPVASKQLDPSKEKINLNIASIEDLAIIKGIGKSLAKAIVDYRTEHGPFSKIEELLKVPGIRSKKLEMLRQNIFVDQIADK